MMSTYTHNAEYLIQCAEHHICSNKKRLSTNPPSKWRSIFSRLNDHSLQIDENKEPISKKLRLSDNPLQSLCDQDKSLNRLIVNLFPSENGYSLMLKTGKQYVETMQLPYDEYDILDFIDNEQIPPLLVEPLLNCEEDMFYSGCVIAEVRDYRIAASLKHFETHYVLLRPTQQSLLGDVDMIASDMTSLMRYGNDEKLALESYLVMATADPLCLDPSPSVQVMKNILHTKSRTFKRHSIKRCIRRNGIAAIRRRRELASLSTSRSFRSFDAVLEAKAKKKQQQTNSFSNIRLPIKALDLWRKTPLELSPPTDKNEVEKYAKPLAPRVAWNSASELLEVQQVHLKSEGTNRDVYSLISILQRPCDMQYFGKLQSNKYFQYNAGSGGSKSNSCKFSLGTEDRANLYILQYQELFAEDGRRPATVTVSRPLQQNPVKYQIPLLQHPWQLEQDKSLYAVGSVNDIPVKLWAKCKANNNVTKPTSLPIQQVNPSQQRTHATVSGVSSANLPSSNSTTTPTLNTITLQPTPQATQSAFVFPIPRQVSHQSSTSPNLVHNAASNARGLERKVSSDTISLLAGADGEIYQIQEVTQQNLSSRRRSRQGSGQDLFSLTSQPIITLAGNNQLTNDNASIVGTSLATPTLADGNNLHSANQNTTNQTAPVSLKLSLPNISTQQHAAQGPVRLQAKVPMVNQQITLQTQQQPGGAIIRMPVSVSGANAGGSQQLTTINLLGRGRNASQGSILGNIQQLQLASGNRTPTGTVTIPANQLPAGIAMQLAAAASNQLNHDKGNSVVTGSQNITIATSGLSSSRPITIVTNNNVAGVQQQQQQQLRVASNRVQTSFGQSSEGQSQSATLTFNPRTQILTANVHGTNVQQPVQLLQVGSNTTLQQLPIRIPGQQLLINPARSTTDQTGSPQMTQLQQFVANSNAAKRPRKRKQTPDQMK